MSAAEITLLLADEAATTRLGGRLALRSRQGDCLLLAGPLGAGKSTLARAFIQALAGAEEEVPSPTFTLVQHYDGASGPIAHLDLYRLETPDEVLELGIEDVLGQAISLVEWPERLGPYRPRRCLELMLEAGGDDNQRRARLISRGGAWDERMEGLA